jgi:hypothetical protein
LRAMRKIIVNARAPGTIVSLSVRGTLTDVTTSLLVSLFAGADRGGV